MEAKITKMAIEGVVPADKSYFVWDGGDGVVKGFGFKVNPNGQRVFVAQFRIGAKRSAPLRRVTIGAYGVWTVERAREAAEEQIRQENDGVDSRAEVDKLKRAEAAAARVGPQEAAQKQEPRLDQLIQRFMDKHVRVKRKKTTIDFYNIIFAKHLLPRLSLQDASDTSRQDISKIFTELAATPTIANRCVTILGAVYNWAIDLEILPEGTRNPCARQEKFVEQGRERFLTTAEFSRLGEALRIAETAGIEWVPTLVRRQNTHRDPKTERS